ncbi:NADH-quinone oxidoreductase subunit NuoG [Pseudomarimonas arenosa]|uniref:NADH-quinone oxidoreductase n=1 Tax=Pseudomarimonas arenosa TaxID=2774145 RepID=A0AAW3ZNS9_9GAMM|nr:NADH-quinone oxidoreductase subunit NuoG [Pseudomarimonas arenosa]MBD8526827.1 NADH-quinone oxidoreductase subunit G [Pseudomarimonas arenosa]
MSAAPQQPAPGMVNVEIDGVAMETPKGSMIIHAADKAGVPIPRFCYHDKLPIAANCRMCLVDVEKAPKPMPACATPVMEGMKIYTRSKRALDAQRNVMEFLLINHPLDCPICDQGGECELQDVAMGYGRSVSRFTERKRVVADENMGPLVATDMTRCIHCTRCVRFCTEIAGTMDLGGMGRGENLSIGTYIGKTIESELSGNVIDVCPVGALTNKPFRFRARAWELTARESIGYHDALGSGLFMHTRRGEVMRCVPRDNESVNESWLSDRDRYSHTGLRSDDRLQAPMIKRGGEWQTVDWPTALKAAADALSAASGEQLGILVHPSTSNEEGQLLAQLAKGLKCGNIDYRIQVRDFRDDPRPQAFSANLNDIEQADVLALVGCHARWEAPILGHRVRKAWKAGAKILSVGAVSFDHNVKLSADVVRSPSALVDFLLAVAKQLSEGREAPPAGLASAISAASADAEASAFAESLSKAERPLIQVGELALNHVDGAWVRELLGYIARCCGARINQLWAGANALGLSQHGVEPSGLDAKHMIDSARAGYLLYGIEPALDIACGNALGALAEAKQVVAFTAYANDTLRDLAQVLLPIGLLPEINASLTNATGETQTVQAGAKLPGEARAGWRVLRALGEQLGLAGFDFNELSELPAAKSDAARRGSELGERHSNGEGLQRIATTPIYGCDAVVRRAAPLQAHPLSRPAELRIHPEDALARGLSQGAMAKVSDPLGTSTLPVVIDAGVARGSVWIESHHPATAALAGTGHVLSVNKA